MSPRKRGRAIARRKKIHRSQRPNRRGPGLVEFELPDFPTYSHPQPQPTRVISSDRTFVALSFARPNGLREVFRLDREGWIEVTVSESK